MRTSIRTTLLLAATAAVVAGCGGSDHKAKPALVDSPPTLTVVTDRSLDQDMTGALAFSVGDRETAAGSLVVSATSSDANVIAPEGLMLGGSGAARTLSISPLEASFGDATITLTVKDAAGQSATRNFRVTVRPVFASFTRFITETFAAGEDSDVRSLKGFTLDSDADDNDGAFDALF